MSHSSSIPASVLEGTTPVITATIEDENGSGFKPTTLALTLYDQKTETIINSRDAQNVLDANGVTVSAGGAVVWTMVAADNAMVSTRAAEKHVALFEWSWDSGTKFGKHEVILTLVNLSKVE